MTAPGNEMMTMSEDGLVYRTEGGLKALKTSEVTTNNKY